MKTSISLGSAGFLTSHRTVRTRRLTAGARLLLGAGLLVLFIGAAGPTLGATFVVDSTVDAGDAAPGDGVCDDGTGACTLRAAIRETNTLAGADVIELPAGTYVLSIAGKSEDNSATGDLDVRGDLTINGAGSAVTIVDANGVDRVFECPQTGAPYAVEISGLTVQNGDSTGSGLGMGGGIAVTNSHSNSSITFTMDDVHLTANTAELRGCGLLLNGQNHGVIRSSVISHNDCPDILGAGAFVYCSVEIIDSTFHDNVGFSGGGLELHAFSGPNEVQGTHFINNTARMGGGLYTAADLTTISECVFDGNHATQVGYSGGYAGAIYNSKVLYLLDSILSGNLSDSTAAALYSGGSSSTYMEVERCLFAGNTTLYYAAGAYAGGGNHFFRDSTFSGNVCGDATLGDGCAIYTAAVPTVTIDNCTFSGNHSNVAGSTALEVYNGAVTVGHSIFAGGSGGGPSCGGTVISAGYNIENGTSCGLGAVGDQPSTDPLLGPLADNGGFSNTHLPLPGSPAIDGGDPAGACTPADQRGAPRPADGDVNGTAECDAGAVEIQPIADLSVLKDDGQTSAVPGTSTVYVITVGNSGPDNTTDAVVTDPFDDPPFDRSQVIWNCSPDPGAGSGTTCPASGTGDDLAAGVTVEVEATDSLTFTATAPIRSEATGTLTNTATVDSGTVGDLNPDNNTSTDEEPLTPEADLWVTKDDGLAFVFSGGSLTYLIEVGNNGPSDEPGATVNDIFPADLNCSWTCVPAGNASCPAGPVAGDIDATVVLPTGDSATFTADCSVSPAATGSIDNTASIAPSAGVTDPQATNDSASDSTGVRQPDFGDAPDPTYPTLLASNGARHGIVSGFHLGAGVDSEVDGLPSEGADGDDLDGTDDEDGVVIPAAIGPGLIAAVDITASSSGLLSAWVDFNADGDWADGGEQVFTDRSVVAGVNPLTFAVPSDAFVGNTFGRFRFDSSGGLGPDGPAVDGEVEDHPLVLEHLADLAVSIGDSPDPVVERGRLTYYHHLNHNGGLDASGVVLTDTLDANVTFVSASDPACVHTSGTVTCNLGSLPAAGSTIVVIEVDVNTGFTGVLSNTATVALNEGDPTPADNTDIETTTVVALGPYIFSDGFESGNTSAWSSTGG